MPENIAISENVAMPVNTTTTIFLVGFETEMLIRKYGRENVLLCVRVATLLGNKQAH